MNPDMGSMEPVASVLGMLAMGLLTSVVAPLLVVAGRRRRRPDADVRCPAGDAAETAGSHPALAVPILLGFGALHAVVVLGPMDGGVAVEVAAHAVLLAGAVLFWLPVLGRGMTRLPEAGRSVYLFLACPFLDMAALALVVRGEELAGIAMIVGMLPIALAAVVLTWRWITGEERAARVADAAVATTPPTVGRMS